MNFYYCLDLSRAGIRTHEKVSNWLKTGHENHQTRSTGTRRREPAPVQCGMTSICSNLHDIFHFQHQFFGIFKGKNTLFSKSAQKMVQLPKKWLSLFRGGGGQNPKFFLNPSLLQRHLIQWTTSTNGLHVLKIFYLRTFSMMKEVSTLLLEEMFIFHLLEIFTHIG